jgi:hypothetical protein
MMWLAILLQLFAGPLSAVAGREPTQSAIGLQLQAAVFAPALITYSKTVDATTMNNPANWPRLHHAEGYDTPGLRSSYVQEASWTPTGSSDAVVFDYAGSLFRAQPGAYDGWQDGSTYWPMKYNNTRFLTCPDLGVPICTRWLLIGDNSIDEMDDTIQLGKCLAETRAFGPAALFTAQTPQITSTLAAVDAAAVGAARRVCRVKQPAIVAAPTGPVLGIDAVRLEPDGAAPDWNLSRHPVGTAARGHTVLIATYYSVTNAPTGSRARFHEVIQVGASVLLDKRDQPFTLALPSRLSRHVIRFVPPSAGSYRVTVTVQVGAASAAGTLTFQVR